MAIFSHPEVNIHDYFYILKKRRFVIISIFLGTILLGLLLTYRSEVLYKATTTILIEKENPNIVDFKEVMAFDAASTDYYQTQYQMLESRSLIEDLIERENLSEDPYFRGMRKGGLRRILKNQPFVPDWLNPFLTDQPLADLIVKKSVDVDPVRNTRLVHVSVTHPDPERAASIANSLVKLYIRKNLENRFMISKTARELLSDQLDELKKKVSEAEKKLQAYKEEHGLINIPSIREKDKFVQDAKLELVKLQAEQARLEKRYLPAHPKLIHIHSQVQALEEKINEEDAKNLQLSRTAIDYSEIEREAESSKQIYEALLARFQEMHSEAKTQASNVMIVDAASPPGRPYKPRPFLNLFVASFIGLFLGVILAFFFEYVDATVKIPDDVEKGLGLELLGIIPMSGKDRKGPLNGEVFFSDKKPSQAAEAFRALRTALLFKLRHVQGCRTLLTTSPNPGEGKSTVSLNLAVAFSQNNLKVLLIDADLRKPKLHSRLGLSHESGLTDILEGRIEPPQAIQQNVQHISIDFLPSGTPSNHPTELLGSNAMKAFLDAMKGTYDIILIDSPPYLAVADVSVLSSFADALMIIAKYHQTEKRHLKDLKRRFSEMKNKIMGVIINQVSVRERDYYYQQYYYYGYGDKQKK